jgi:hypothetical protein
MSLSVGFVSSIAWRDLLARRLPVTTACVGQKSLFDRAGSAFWQGAFCEVPILFEAFFTDE